MEYVWCALSRKGIICTVVFWRKSSDSYGQFCALCPHGRGVFFLSKLEELDVGDVWFQQDSVTARTARMTMNPLREYFPGRLTGRSSMIEAITWFNPVWFLFVGISKILSLHRTSEDLRSTAEQCSSCYRHVRRYERKETSKLDYLHALTRTEAIFTTWF